MLTNQFFSGKKTHHTIDSTGQFPQWTYSSHGQFQASNTTSLNRELGRDTQQQILTSDFHQMNITEVISRVQIINKRGKMIRK